MGKPEKGDRVTVVKSYGKTIERGDRGTVADKPSKDGMAWVDMDSGDSQHMMPSEIRADENK